MALMMKNLNNDTDVFVAQTSSIGTDGVLAIELLGDLTETDDDDKVCGCGGGYNLKTVFDGFNTVLRRSLTFKMVLSRS